MVEKWKPLLDRKKQAFDICVEVEVEEFLIYISESCLQRDPGVRKNHIQSSTVPLDSFIQPIQIVQVGNIARYSCRLLADFSNGCVQHVLATACDEYTIHPFQYEALCCC